MLEFETLIPEGIEIDITDPLGWVVEGTNTRVKLAVAPLTSEVEFRLAEVKVLGVVMLMVKVDVRL